MEKLGEAELAAITGSTVASYDANAEGFWEGTRGHDVSQNVEALLDAIDGDGAHRILDLGCGPGRDLADFVARGHAPIGIDAAERFVGMARQHAGVEVWQQNLLALDLPTESFDGVFANASLFHVPGQEIARVLRELWACLKPQGVLFASNPRGQGQEGWNGDRYGAFRDAEAWNALATEAGFVPIRHYYRPAGKPRDEQPWLAVLWRRP